MKEIKTIAEGRGRKLKAKYFPALGLALEYVFGELDIQKGGRGLEAHPCLTTGTLYRGAAGTLTLIGAGQQGKLIIMYYYMTS